MYETEKEMDRKILYKDTTIEIEGKNNEHVGGIVDWRLRVKKVGRDMKEQDTTIHYSMNHLSDIVKGIEDYYNLNTAIDKNFDFAEHKKKFIRLWLEIGRITREIGIYSSAMVAYIKPEVIYLKGEKVMPKPWENPIQGEIVIDYSNFELKGLYFRLYLFDSQKKNTYYIDLDPINDRKDIERLLEDSIAIYTPYLHTDYNMNSIVYPYIEKTSMR